MPVDGMVDEEIQPNEAVQDLNSSISSGLLVADISKARKSIDSERVIFSTAHSLLRPSAFYRYVIYLYAERKLMVVFSIHFIATMIIWVHFGLIKFHEQYGKVPEGANRYWWKVLVPSLEFGSMHAILFQAALLPLTMARLSIASLSQSFLDNLIPLNRALHMHIHLGYTMITIVILAICLFFTFFGLLCSDGEQAFCDKFTTEIMITGYVIFFVLLLVGGTSYLRHTIRYELFYAIHHVVFIMYAITVAHTMDVEQRTGAKDRSQTFKWFSLSLLYYLCDRTAMHLNHRYTSRLLSSSTPVGSTTDDSRMVLLKMNRPVLFRFKPGQYAFLRVPAIDAHWHPFSIASGPDSSILEFYVDVAGEKSWTNKLWNLLTVNTQSLSKKNGLGQSVEVMGPYGTSLAKTEEFSHVLAIGAGTGIVPVISLFKEHVRNMLQLDPCVYLDQLQHRDRMILQAEIASENRKGSLAWKLARVCVRRNKTNKGANMTRKDMWTSSLRESISRHITLETRQDIRENLAAMKQAAFVTTRSIYGVVVLASLPVLGVALFGMIISWNTLPFDMFPGMITALKVVTIVFQASFAAVTLCIWDSNNILALVDFVLCSVNPFADGLWFQKYDSNGHLSPVDITMSCILVGYMTARLWLGAVMPRHISWKKHVERGFTSKLDRLDVVWTTRSAAQVAELLPDIVEIWETLVDAWGVHDAFQVCRIQIYVTDKDKTACRLLAKQFELTPLFQLGALHFRRLDISRTIENFTLDLVCHRRSSYSLVSFCGSPQLAREVHQQKISNDMVTAITGNKKHQTEFVSESYGGPSKVRVYPAKTLVIEKDRSPPTRQNSSYGQDRRNSLRMIYRHPTTDGHEA